MRSDEDLRQLTALICLLSALYFAARLLDVI